MLSKMFIMDCSYAIFKKCYFSSVIVVLIVDFSCHSLTLCTVRLDDDDPKILQNVQVQKFNNITANSASLKKNTSPLFGCNGIAIDFVLNLGYYRPQRAGLGVGRSAI